MAIIQKFLNIPEDRRLKLDLELPRDIPSGAAKIIIVIKPVSKKKSKRGVLDFWGIFKDHPAFQGDPVEIQRKMRDGW
ncbi:MAG: hypothetical protein LBQ12_05065 [Deltaproteobacteria bacterium]|jgi:hypothetical protein|nr:hypothetical protein [Deltaproteobacteria bacterium]